MVLMLLLMVGVGLLASFIFPLVDATYTDFAARMTLKKGHIIGLSGSTLSIAYVVGPILGGLLATLVGDQSTFGVVGVVVILTGIVLLMVTPKKIHLLQSEIKEWGG